MTYTPTTEEVRDVYGYAQTYRDFDRWLEAHDREVKAEALEGAVTEWESGNVDFQEIKYLSKAPHGWTDKAVGDSIMATGPFIDWLRNRAQQLKEQQ